VPVHDYDVIAVGGGLGGAAVAKVMATAGARVLVLEQEAKFKDRVRGEFMARWRRMGGPAKRDLRKRWVTLISCLFAGPCPAPDLALSGRGGAADLAESRPGAAAGCPALSGGLFGMDLVGLIAGPILFRYPFLSLLFDEACDVRWPTRGAHRNDVVASRP
jgi:FAD binding domain